MNLSVWMQQQFGKRPQAVVGVAPRRDLLRWGVWGAVCALVLVVLWPDLVALFSPTPVPPLPSSPLPSTPLPVAPAPVTATTTPTPTPEQRVPAPPSAAQDKAPPAPDTGLASGPVGVEKPSAALPGPLPPSASSAAAVTATPEPAPRAGHPSTSAQSSRPLPAATPGSSAERAEMLYQKGMRLQQQGRDAEAEALLQQALQMAPAHVFARQALASIQIEAGRMLQAEVLLQQGLQLAPAEKGWAVLLARLQLERGDRQTAIETLRASLGHAPATAVHNAEAHAFLAALLQQQGGHDAEAASHYITALRLMSDRGVWWMGLGISLQASGEAEQAAAAYRRALIAPGLPAHLRVFIEQRLQQVSP